MATPDLAPEEIYDLAKIALAQAHDINHIISRGVACRPLASRRKWKVEWKIWVGCLVGCVAQQAGVESSLQLLPVD